MDFQYEGGDMFKDEQGAKKKEEPTAEELAEAKKKLEIASAKAKELLWGYIGDSKCLMAAGLFLNLLGMVGEFASPLFIGLVVDAIVAKNQDDVKRLIMWWMVVNTAGAFFAGVQRFVFALLTEKIG